MQGELFEAGGGYVSQASRVKKSATYEEFVEKFKPKKTTDDCYTPADVYEVVKDFAVELWRREHSGTPFVMRPFYPGGDYQNETYPENAYVVDNPPFSIMAKILDFYKSRRIPYFLFADGRTLFSCFREYRPISFVVVSNNVVYENGAKVNTGFITNVFARPRLILSKELAAKIAMCESQPDTKNVKRGYRARDFYSSLDFSTLVKNFGLDREYNIENAPKNDEPYSTQLRVPDAELRELAEKQWK